MRRFSQRNSLVTLNDINITPLVDVLTLSSHKFGGPKGMGVMMQRTGVALAPFILGGGQERDRRSGTHNVAGIVAMATALRITDERRTEETTRTSRTVFPASTTNCTTTRPSTCWAFIVAG